MAQRRPAPLQLTSPAHLMATTSTALAGDAPVRELSHISQQVRIGLAIQASTALKVYQGAQLAETLAVRSLHHFDAFVAQDRQMRDQRHYGDDQTAVDAFSQAVRLACAAQDLSLSWIGECELRRDPERVRMGAGGETVTLIPDGYYLLHREERTSHLFWSWTAAPCPSTPAARCSTVPGRGAWPPMPRGCARGISPSATAVAPCVSQW